MKFYVRHNGEHFEICKGGKVMAFSRYAAIAHEICRRMNEGIDLTEGLKAVA